MSGRVVVLTGGVGGAKLVVGLCAVMPPGHITAIVNTSDDFRHLGLWISPDIDTLLYTLSGQSNQEQGWGRENESWSFMAAIRSLAGADWFALGDGDLALHVLRTHWLSDGRTLSAITRDVARRWGIGVNIVPMSDDPVSTIVATDDGELPFQRYFVEHRCAPLVRALRFHGSEASKPTEEVLKAICDPSTSAILIAPSNPYLSIDPILAVPGIRDAIAKATAPVVAVSPVLAGAAIKGPTAKLMREFGIEVGPAAIAKHYEGLIDALLVDQRDRDAELTIAHSFADTLMTSLADRARVASAALDLAAGCAIR